MSPLTNLQTTRGKDDPNSVFMRISELTAQQWT